MSRAVGANLYVETARYISQKLAVRSPKQQESNVYRQLGIQSGFIPRCLDPASTRADSIIGLRPLVEGRQNPFPRPGQRWQDHNATHAQGGQALVPPTDIPPR